MALLIRPPMVVKENGQIKNFNSKEKFIQWMRENYPDKIRWEKDITVQDIVRQLNGFY